MHKSFSMVDTSKFDVVISNRFFDIGCCRGDTVLRKVRDLGGHVCRLLAAEGKKARLVSKVNLKGIWRSTSGRVNQRAAKQTRGFPHQQQERNRSFQSKRSQLNEKKFLSRSS